MVSDWFVDAGPGWRLAARAFMGGALVTLVTVWASGNTPTRSLADMEFLGGGLVGTVVLGGFIWRGERGLTRVLAVVLAGLAVWCFIQGIRPAGRAFLLNAGAVAVAVVCLVRAAWGPGANDRPL